MNSRVILNLVLAGAVIVLAVVAMLEPGRTPEPGGEKLTPSPPQQVNKIEIKRADNTTIALERTGQWRVRFTRNGKPFTHDADEWKVNAILQLASAEASQCFDVDAGNLAKYGLDTPRATVSFDETVYTVGDTNPLSKQRYVLLNERVCLIADVAYTHLIGLPADYISRGLFPDNTKIVSLQLPDLKLVKTSDGRWDVDPAPQNVSADAAQQLVDEWQYAQALTVEESTNTSSGKRVRVTTSDGAEIEFEAVANDNGCFLNRRDLGLRYRFTKNAETRLFQLPEPHTIAP